MPQPSYTHLGGLRDIESFRRYLSEHQINIPCDRTLTTDGSSPLAQPIDIDGTKVGNRIAAQPMEGWDGTREGRPTELTFHRWERFGASGAKLIWGGEAVAVRHDGRANPNQLLINKHSRDDLSRLRQTLVTAHKQAVGSDSPLIIGLQLTHSGRYSQPSAHSRPEPKIVYHHPTLDSRLGITPDYPWSMDHFTERVRLYLDRDSSALLSNRS